VKGENMAEPKAAELAVATRPGELQKWELPPVDSTTAAAALERLVIQGDMSKLQPMDRVIFYRAVCQATGLNPLTRPFDYLTLQGKLILYPNKGCAEQLRQIHGVRVVSMTKPEVDKEERLVSVHVVLEDKYGRRDEDFAYLPLDQEVWSGPEGQRRKVLEEAKGVDLANLKMKVQTKAKRRSTLSLCGLGAVDLEDDDPRVIEARANMDKGNPWELSPDTRVVVGQSQATAATEVVPAAGAAPEQGPSGAGAVVEPQPAAAGNGGKKRPLQDLTDRAKARVRQADPAQGSLIPPTDPPPAAAADVVPDRVEPAAAAVDDEDPDDGLLPTERQAMVESTEQGDMERTLALAKISTLRGKVTDKLFMLALSKRNLRPDQMGTADPKLLESIVGDLEAVATLGARR